jgi:NAD-dependent SIR2 family protein deacetylase
MATNSRNHIQSESNNISAKCACWICRNNKDFVFPKQLLEEVKKRNVVIFAGAGISTESRTVFPSTFYENIATELGVSLDKAPDFSNLMSKFCKRPNGRRELLMKIRDRFDYVESFPFLYNIATAFHQELSTIHQIENIITTNWDDYFERECAAVPFVTAKDFALWEIPRRKVFKIHGSLSNISSIVATKEDYDGCYRELTRGAIGAALKAMLSTKTIVFVGYSLNDSDFIKIRKILTSAMGDVFPHSYIVAPDETSNTVELKNSTKIITSGQHFLRRLKEHLVKDKAMISDEVFKEIEEIHGTVSAIHFSYISKIKLREKPATVLTAAYQDGMLHAFQRIDARKRSGEYSHCCKVSSLIHGYEKYRKDYLKRKRYYDAAYVQGYQNVLFLLVFPKRMWKHIPILYVFGAKKQPKTIQAYERLLKSKRTFSKAVDKHCLEIIKNSNADVDGIVIEHLPFL